MGPKNRLSWESERLSPMTKYSSGGIFWVVMPVVTVPGTSHGSLSGLPLITTWPPADEIVSPGRPMTRLTRSFTSGPASLAGRRGEDHDVAPVDGVEVVAELVDQDAVADHERRLHRGRRDEEGLDDEGPDADGHDDGHDEHDRPLDDPAPPPPGPGGGRSAGSQGGSPRGLGGPPRAGGAGRRTR